MKAKLQHLIKSEGLTASRFAEMLEIQPAGVSHILAGRNKPSFDLLQKILRRFPKINPDWLLLDSEQMYRDGWENSDGAMGGATTFGAFGSGNNLGADNNFGSGDSSQNQGMPAGSLFGGANGGMNGGGSNFPNGHSGSNYPNRAINAGNTNGGANGTPNGATGNLPFGARNLSPGESYISGMQGVAAGLSNSRAGFPVEKIVIFYADGSFEAYSPASRQG